LWEDEEHAATQASGRNIYWGWHRDDGGGILPIRYDGFIDGINWCLLGGLQPKHWRYPAQVAISGKRSLIQGG